MATRRQEQNKALRDVEALAGLMPQLLKEARHVILRNDYTSGQRQHQSGELGATKPTHVDMTGTPPPYSGDPTGEDACWEEMPDATGKAISRLCEMLGKCLDSALAIHDLSNTDVRVRATRTIPDCLACGDPCLDGVRSGFDDKCRKRWDRLGRPDRNQFIAMIKEERLAVGEQEDKASHAID